MTTKRLGVIMNGVTGRMGLNQHLIRSIIAIRDSGGVLLGNGDRMMPDPILVSRDAGKVEHLARQFNVARWTTDLDAALALASRSGDEQSGAMFATFGQLLRTLRRGPDASVERAEQDVNTGKDPVSLTANPMAAAFFHVNRALAALVAIDGERACHMQRLPAMFRQGIAEFLTDRAKSNAIDDGAISGLEAHA